MRHSHWPFHSKVAGLRDTWGPGTTIVILVLAVTIVWMVLENGEMDSGETVNEQDFDLFEATRESDGWTGETSPHAEMLPVMPPGQTHPIHLSQHHGVHFAHEVGVTFLVTTT